MRTALGVTADTLRFMYWTRRVGGCSFSDGLCKQMKTAEMKASMLFCRTRLDVVWHKRGGLLRCATLI